jgi:hypothetical protein
MSTGSQETRSVKPAAKRPPAKGKPAPKQSDVEDRDQRTDDGQEEDEVADVGGMAMFLMVPSWLVSLLVHIVLLLALAFLTFAVGSDEVKVFISVNPTEEDEAIEELTEIQLEKLEDIEDVSTNDMLEPESMAFANITVPVMVETNQNVDDLLLNETTIDEIMAKNNPIKKNNSHNGIWGIRLGAGKKKKKR